MSAPNKPYEIAYRGHRIVISGDEKTAAIYSGDTLCREVAEHSEIVDDKESAVTSLVAAIRWIREGKPADQPDFTTSDSTHDTPITED